MTSSPPAASPTLPGLDGEPSPNGPEDLGWTPAATGREPIRFPIPPSTPPKACTCGATIYWIVTPTKNRMPVDADGTSHFARCPHAGQHRRPRPSRRKPTPAEIARAVPLTSIAIVKRASEPLLVCDLCGVDVPVTEPLRVWREHDEHDRPRRGLDPLVFVGSGPAHAECRAKLEKHPRAYTEETAGPGYFPELCGPCVHRVRLVCRHPELKANGGPGLRVSLPIFGQPGLVCIKGARGPLVRYATRCSGRTVLHLVDDELAAESRPS